HLELELHEARARLLLAGPGRLELLLEPRPRAIELLTGDLVLLPGRRRGRGAKGGHLRLELRGLASPLLLAGARLRELLLEAHALLLETCALLLPGSTGGLFVRPAGFVVRPGGLVGARAERAALFAEALDLGVELREPGASLPFARPRLGELTHEVVAHV